MLIVLMLLVDPPILPDRTLTPGRATSATTETVCSAAGTYERAIDEKMIKRVLKRYGLQQSTAVRIDRLIPLELGGADSIENLWPQWTHNAVWTPERKDRLAARLRQLVCDSQLSLERAQQIIAGHWINAYQHYVEGYVVTEGR